MAFPTKLYGIVGYPLGHSMSPLLHNWAFQKTGFPGFYMAWPEPVNKIRDFFAAVRTLDIQGGNITIPHKVSAMDLVDFVSDTASLIGAINTFYWKDGALCGENTDINGFMAPLKHKNFRHALVLGAGGVCRAVLAGLQELGVAEISITNRTETKAELLAEIFNVQAIPWNKRTEPDADLIINATSIGMRGEQSGMTPYPASALAGRTGLVYDIVYNPLQTRLLQEARSAGWQVENGLTMFVEQARAAFSLWTGGREMPLQQAKAKVAEALGL